MLLKSCYIQGFGKLQDFTYEFTEGLNIICTENGWGKSTFAAFLRAMLYGLPQAGSRTKLEEAERRKYRPWNGGIMGGSLIFEINGKEYKAERTFGKKEAEDTFRLIDLSTNLDSGDFSADLGKELFGLDKEAYSRSTYLPQNKITDGGMNDSIGKKLGRMAEGEEESGNFDKAYEALEELRKRYIPDRQKEEKGYVAELTRKLSDAQAGLDACRRKEESAKPWREKEQSAALQKKEAEAQLRDCREALEKAAGYEALAAKKRHYTELCGQEEKLRVKKESMQGLFRAGVPELAKLRKCRQEAEEAAVLAGELRSCRLSAGETEELELLRGKFGKGVPDREELQECIRTESEVKEQFSQTEQGYRRTVYEVNRTKKLKRVCFGLAVLFFLLAAVSGVGTLVLARESKEKPLPETQETLQEKTDSSANVGKTIMAGTGAVLALAGIVTTGVGLQKKKKEEEAEKRLYEYSTEIERLGAKRERGPALLVCYGKTEDGDVTGALYRLAEEAGRFELLSERWEKQEQCFARREELLRNCTAVLEQNGMESEDVAGSLSVLETRTRDFLRISEELAEAVKKREQFERETLPDSFYGLTAPERSFGELQKEEQELLVKIARIAEEEKDCRDRAETFEAEAESCGDLEELCEELKNRLETKKREHFYITETIKCLKTAKERFSSRYLRGLTEGFEKYVSLLGTDALEKSTDGHFNGVCTDINLNVQVSAYGEGKELGYFSTGIKDLIGLCMRFALVDALFPEEEPFLVLDDPFVNLDKEKIQRATKLLRETAKQYQILYLVCHESRV